jgi:hypothetical protein
MVVESLGPAFEGLFVVALFIQLAGFDKAFVGFVVGIAEEKPAEFGGVIFNESLAESALSERPPKRCGPK